MFRRSAITGRHLSNAAARPPCTTVTQHDGNTSSSTHSRSSIPGRYVTEGTVRRHPNTTVTERGTGS